MPSAISSAYTYASWMHMTQDGGTIFLHTIQTAYAHLMYKSTDDGASWSSFDILGGETFAPIVFDINSDGSVIVCVGGTSSVNGWVSISKNSGASFSAYHVETAVGYKLVPRGVSVNEAGTKLMCRGVSYSGVGYDRLFTSTDSAENWTVRNPSGSSSKLCSAIDISSDGSTMYAVHRGTVAPTDRLYISTNDGVSWSDINPSSNASNYALGTNEDGSTVVGTGAGATLYISYNAGGDWSTVEPAGSLAADEYLSWYYNALGLGANSISIVGDRIVALGGKPHGRNIYVSLDEGATWSEKRIGVTFQEFFTSVGVTADGQSIIVCNEDDGIYTSVDGGSTFIAALDIYNYSDGDYTGGDSDGHTVDVSSDGSVFILCARTYGKSYYSIDDGATWDFFDYTGGGIDDWENDAEIYSADISDDGDVIVLTGEFYNDWAIGVSVDGGVTWSESSPPVALSGINYRIAVTGDGLVFYLTEQVSKALYRSVDSGSSWTLVKSAISASTLRGLAVSDDGDVIIINDAIGLWLSDDNGVSFTRVNDGYGWYAGNDFSDSQSLNDTGNIITYFIERPEGVYAPSPVISIDKGSTWELLDDTLDVEYYVSQVTGTDTNFSILMGYEYLYLTIVITEEVGFSDAGYYPAVYIHGKRIEDGESALKNQTQVDMDWKLPFAYPYIIGAPDDIIEYRRIRVQHTTPFWTKEKSLEDSRPIELHRFSTATEIWRYADAPCDVDYNGTDGVVIFRGFVQNVNFKQDSRNGVRRAEVTIEPYSGNTLLQALAMTYERLCPVALYGELCGVDQDESGAAWHDSGLLTGVTNTILTADEFGNKVDGWYNGGKIVIDNRRRKILTHTGTSITISRTIQGAAIGDSFDVYAGCDRLPATCASKFDNLNNCKALPNIPHEDNNPFGTNGAVQ